jgi:chondroitin 4-sulfotransferase 11
VANSTMKALCADLIRDQLDDRFLAEHWSDRWKPRIFRDPQARQYLQRKSILLSSNQLRDYDDYWRFCLVRNPWTRVISCWKQKIRRADDSQSGELNGVAQNLLDNGYDDLNMTFKQFVTAIAEIPDGRANRHFRSQYTFVSRSKCKPVVDYIGRMENLTADLEVVFEKIGIPRRDVPHLLQSNALPASHYYDDETRGVIGDRYAEDIQMFQYVFGDD